MDCKKISVEEGKEDLHLNLIPGLVEETREPLNLFPEELWLEIFKHLDNPRDLLQVGESCSFFKDLLERGSPAVPGAGKDVCQLVEILPLVLKWLGKEDILSLRKVCKRVSLIVDQVIEKNPLINPYESFNLFPWLIAPLPLESPRRLTFESRNIKLPWKICPNVRIYSGEEIFGLTVGLMVDNDKRAGRKVKIVGKRVSIDWGSTPGQNVLFEIFEQNDILVKVVDTDSEEVDCSDGEDEELSDIGEDVDEYVIGGDEDEQEPLARDDQAADVGGDDEGLQELPDDVIAEDEDQEEEDDDIEHLEEVNEAIEDTEESERLFAKDLNHRLTQQRAFLSKCTEFLNGFLRNHVRFLDITIGEASDSFTEAYKLLRQVISSLPNLQRLEYRARSGFRHPETIKEATELKKFIDGYPLPSAPNLECISTKYIFWPEEYLREVCDRYGDQLKELTLIIDSKLFEEEEEGDLPMPSHRSHYEFPVLQKLTLQIAKPVLDVIEVDAPLLKSFESRNTLEENLGPFNVNRLITLIMKYPQLVELQVDLTNVIVPRPSVALVRLEREGVEHTNLKHLTIMHGDDSNIPLAFFTRLCPNLESITFEDDLERGGHQTTMNVDLYMMRARCMKKSAIWEEAANLQKVKHAKLFYDQGRETKEVYVCNRP